MERNNRYASSVKGCSKSVNLSDRLHISDRKCLQCMMHSYNSFKRLNFSKLLLMNYFIIKTKLVFNKISEYHG